MRRISFVSWDITWEGRIYETDDTVTAAFPGVNVRFHFSGGSAIATICSSSFDCWIRIGINGDFSRKVQLKQGPNRITLVDQLFEGEISIYRCTESWQGILTFESIEFDGELEKCQHTKKEKLMFIGDSITCGGGTLLEGDAPLNQSVTNDAFYSFGPILGRQRDAEVHLVSYGGRGLYRDWQGFTSEKINNAPEFFERSLPDRDDLKWNHVTYQPDRICIGLGQNDFNQGIVDPQIWIPAYEKFIQRVRTVHPKAKISIMNSPMQGEGETRAKLIEFLKKVCESTGSQFIELPYLPGTKDAHPDSKGHQKIAELIQAAWK